MSQSQSPFRFMETLFNRWLTLERWIRGERDLFVVRVTDSVSGLLYDQDNDRVLLIRQGRAAMVRENNPDGSIVELIAGRFDVKLSARALFVKEALEEAGVTLSEGQVALLNDGRPMAISPGVLTERCTLAFAAITASQMDGKGDTGRGAAEEGEDIERFWMNAGKFIQGPHDDLRVFTLARFLQAYRLRRTRTHGC